MKKGINPFIVGIYLSLFFSASSLVAQVILNHLSISPQNFSMVPFLFMSTLFILFVGHGFFNEVTKKDIKEGYIPKHSKAAGIFTLFALILLWIIGLFVIFEKSIPETFAGLFYLAILLPLWPILFITAFSLLTIVGIKSYREEVAIIKPFGRLTGKYAKIAGIFYILLGGGALILTFSAIFSLFK